MPRDSLRIVQITAICAKAGAAYAGYNRQDPPLNDAETVVIAAGSLFVFQGPLRGVLISYPSPQDLKRILS